MYKRLESSKGDTLYLFEVRQHGRRFRHRVRCPASSVRAVYRQWFESLTVERPATIFEMTDKYLAHRKVTVPPRIWSHDRHVVQMIRRYFGNRRLDSITRGDVESFATWRARQRYRGKGDVVSPATVNRSIQVLSNVFTFAIKQGRAEKNPCHLTKRREHNVIDVWYGAEQVREILTMSGGFPEVYTGVMLALFAGLRLSEALNLQWADVDLSRGVLTVLRGKGGKSRVVAMPETLTRHLAGLDHNHGQVVPLTRQRWRLRWVKVRDRLSFPVGYHSLRHQYAQGLRHEGVPLADISRLLGHSSVAVTERYATSATGRITEKVRVLDQLWATDGQHLGNTSGAEGLPGAVVN